MEIKMAKTQTKTEIRNTAAKIGKMLRGIDNNAALILKEKKKLDERVEAVQRDTRAVQTLISSFSNTAIAAAGSSQVNGQTAGKPKVGTSAKAVGADQKSAPKTKDVRGIKSAKATKAQKKQAEKKVTPSKETKQKKTKEKKEVKESQAKNSKLESTERLPMKIAIAKVLEGGHVRTSGEIYKLVVENHGYYSRQSLYNALKDSSTFSKEGDKYKLASGGNENRSDKNEADAFVESVERNSAVANVV